MTTTTCMLEPPMTSARQMAGQLGGCVSPATVIRCDEPLARYTTLRVGGPADVLVEPASEEDLAAIAEILHRARLCRFL